MICILYIYLVVSSPRLLFNNKYFFIYYFSFILRFNKKINAIYRIPNFCKTIYIRGGEVTPSVSAMRKRWRSTTRCAAVRVDLPSSVARRKVQRTN